MREELSSQMFPIQLLSGFLHFPSHLKSILFFSGPPVVFTYLYFYSFAFELQIPAIEFTVSLMHNS